MKRIAITGGIASGKSTVSAYIVKMGYDVIDADEIGHELLKEDDVKMEVVAKTGVSLTDGEIDRKALANIVFNDVEKLKILNSILHVRIVKRVLERFDSYDANEVFVEAAVLFEMKLDRYVDFVVVTDCPDEIRIKRLMERNNFSEKEALVRIRSQMSREEFLKRADHVIDTSKTLKHTFEEVSKLLQLKPWSDKI